MSYSRHNPFVPNLSPEQAADADMRALREWSDAIETAGTPEHQRLGDMFHKLPDANDPFFDKLPGDEMLAKLPGFDDPMFDRLPSDDMFDRLPDVCRSRARNMGPDSFGW